MLKNVAADNESLSIPFYKEGAIIVPKNTPPNEVMDIYVEIVNTKQTNKEILCKRDFLKMDLEVIIIGSQGEIVLMSDFV